MYVPHVDPSETSKGDAPFPDSAELGLRLATPADVKNLVSLWRDIFGPAMTEAHWNWKQGQNPAGEALSCVLYQKDNEKIKGHLGMVPVGLSYFGRRMTAHQLVDGMIDPDIRERGAFSKLLDFCQENAAKHKTRLTFGTPNRKSFPALVKQGKHYRLDCLTRYSITAKGRLSKSLKLFRLHSNTASLRRDSANLSFEHLTQLPEDYEELWTRANGQEVFSIWKDTAYLQWRYEQCPSHKSRFSAVRNKEKLVAICVYRLDADGSACVSDVVAAFESLDVARLLVVETTRMLLREGAGSIGFYGHSKHYFDTIFADFPSRIVPEFVSIVRPMNASRHMERLMLCPDNWIFSWGDSDTV